MCCAGGGGDTGVGGGRGGDVGCVVVAGSGEICADA